MEGNENEGERLDLDREKLQGVARRPVGGSPKNFLRDLR